MIPDNLRPHLEGLGAEITPLADGATEVQVPGARRRWRLERHARRNDVSVRQVETPGQRPRLWYSGDIDSVNEYVGRGHLRDVLHRIAEGRQGHDGPDHEFLVHQTVDGDEKSGFRRGYYTSLVTHPDTTSEAYFTQPPGRGGHGVPDETTGLLAPEVLEGRAPIEALVDHVADLHGVSHLVRSHPSKFARAYAAVVRGLNR